MDDSTCKDIIVKSLLGDIFTLGHQVHDSTARVDTARVVSARESPLLSYAQNLALPHFKEDVTGAIGQWIEKLAEEPSDAQLHHYFSLIKYTDPPAPNPENETTSKLQKRESGELSRKQLDLLEVCKTRFIDLQLAWEREVQPDDSSYARPSFDSPMVSAGRYDCFRVSSVLLDAGAAIDGVSRLEHVGNPLFVAAWYGSDKIFLDLLRRGANINVRVPLYDTVLYCATLGAPQHVETLLKMGADTNVPDDMGLTIHYWAQRDNKIRRSMAPFAVQLEALRSPQSEFVDLQTRRDTVLRMAKDLRSRAKGLVTSNIYQLYHALFFSDTKEEATIIAESQIIRSDTGPISHWGTFCHICGKMYGTISGPATFVSIVWISITALIVAVMCQGHHLVVIPRKVWYTLPEGTVNEKGETLDQVLEPVQRYWETLDVTARKVQKTPGFDELVEDEESVATLEGE
ncbi:hypothetical protein H2200_010527 [Cladophialophora chaetospira]|uniref:Ankyrin repeat protein n=1 Tax=Cladophialophora chaetospira TaxID=386627 RepID=A0AA39CEE5_9EURO|nr:hypothetical protein H2200_010527 [Cladophialophora chaetospira]